MISNDLVVSTENLSRSFGEVTALKSLDLRVPQRSIFAFLGPNGAGKTTTIKLLLGLLKPTSGSGKILGMDILHDSVDIRARIGQDLPIHHPPGVSVSLRRRVSERNRPLDGTAHQGFQTVPGRTEYWVSGRVCQHG